MDVRHKRVYGCRKNVRISERFFDNHYKSSRQKIAQTIEIKNTAVIQKLPKRNGQTQIFGSQPLYIFQNK
jgi:hypothetical protein